MAQIDDKVAGKVAGNTRPARMPSKRRVLWGAFLVVLVPLMVLLALQYRWLVDLEHTSTVARQVKLQGYLSRIAKEVAFFYRSTAERALNMDAILLDPTYLEKKAGKFFRSKDIEGVSRLFVVSFLHPKNFYWLYDPETHEMLGAEGLSSELQAILLATASWNLLHHKDVTVEYQGFVVEERDPEHRMILNPIVDENSKVAGLVGLIVDQEYFRTRVLPKAIEESWPSFSPLADDLVVLVRDSAGRQLWPEEPVSPAEATKKGHEIRRPFVYLFTDWQVAVRGRTSTPAEWARSNFAFNVTLSIVLSVVLLGGLALVLRTTAREMRLSEMKNDFVSNVSHELRTPLASIRVFGEFLRLGRASSPEKVREYGEYIETESRRLTQLINNILDFSRIESGCREYSFEAADLEAIVDDVLKTFSIRLRRSGFEIELERPPSPLPEIRVDRDAIRQALFNLLDNAVKYSGDGRRIQVGVARQGALAVVSVRDFGIGVDRHEQEKIFDRFHRVGTRLVHDVKGTGLGLSIVAHIVQAHGGEVRLVSEPGAGSTFSIHLPFSPGESVAAVDADAEGVAPRLQQTA